MSKSPLSPPHDGRQRGFLRDDAVESEFSECSSVTDRSATTRESDARIPSLARSRSNVDGLRVAQLSVAVSHATIYYSSEGKVVKYSMKVEHNGAHWVVDKRYSELHAFHNKLKSLHKCLPTHSPSGAASPPFESSPARTNVARKTSWFSSSKSLFQLPAFPTKHLLGRTSDSVKGILNRRRDLNTFMAALCDPSAPFLRCEAIVQSIVEFVTESASGDCEGAEPAFYPNYFQVPTLAPQPLPEDWLLVASTNVHVKPSLTSPISPASSRGGFVSKPLAMYIPGLVVGFPHMRLTFGSNSDLRAVVLAEKKESRRAIVYRFYELLAFYSMVASRSPDEHLPEKDTVRDFIQNYRRNNPLPPDRPPAATILSLSKDYRTRLPDGDSPRQAVVALADGAVGSGSLDEVRLASVLQKDPPESMSPNGSFASDIKALFVVASKESNGGNSPRPKGQSSILRHIPTINCRPCGFTIKFSMPTAEPAPPVPR